MSFRNGVQLERHARGLRRTRLSAMPPLFGLMLCLSLLVNVSATAQTQNANCGQDAQADPSPLLKALLEKSQGGQNPYELVANVPAEEGQIHQNFLRRPNSTEVLVGTMETNLGSYSYAFWDVATGAKTRDLELSEAGRQRLEEFSPDGKQLFGTSLDAVYVVDIDSGRAKTVAKAGDHSFFGYCGCAEKNLMVTCDTSFLVRGWDLDTGEKKFEYQADEPKILMQVKDVPKSKYVLYADGALKLIDTESGQLVRKIDVPGGAESFWLSFYPERSRNRKRTRNRRTFRGARSCLAAM